MLTENKNLVKSSDETTAACEACGQCDVQLFEIDGKMMCAECLEREGYAICKDCGRVERVDDMYLTEDDEYICEDCRYNYLYCEECGRYYPEDEVQEVRNGWRSTMYVCENCLTRYCWFRQCDDCGTWCNVNNTNMVHTAYGTDVCDDCADNYYYCEECGEYYNEDDIMFDDDSDMYLCRNCYEEAHASGKLHDYGFKPEPKFLVHKDDEEIAPVNYDGRDIDAFTYGFENEVDKGPISERATAIAEITEITDDVYMKHDGSLDTGFEIVSHPATLEYHMKDMKLREICQIVKDHGFKSHDARTCGLHVHVGRYQLGNGCDSRRKTIANILLLVDRHWDMLVKFSRRRGDQLDHWARRPQILRPVNGDTEERAQEKALHADNGNRYQAVNLNNTGTIEFRIFNGTLKRDTIIATIQFLDNLCHYAKEHSTTECLASKWEDITEYAHYDELDSYLRERGIVNADNPDAIDIYDAEETPKRENKFEIGTRVVCTGDEYGDEPMGLTGEVMAIENDGMSIGVYFPTFHGGHNLWGILTGDRSSSGWWVHPDDLAIALAS